MFNILVLLFNIAVQEQINVHKNMFVLEFVMPIFPKLVSVFFPVVGVIIHFKTKK